ncbi:MAG: 30S ribosomal protein S27ae [Candidatus Woesearchaeota archaeon]
MAAKKPAAGKGKGKKEKRQAYKAGSVYDVSGGSIKPKAKTCPKCGGGIYMAQHKNRSSCGKCGYTEMK